MRVLMDTGEAHEVEAVAVVEDPDLRLVFVTEVGKTITLGITETELRYLGAVVLDAADRAELVRRARQAGQN